MVIATSGPEGMDCSPRGDPPGFAIDGKPPATVIVVRVTSVYTQCPKALVRSKLWDPERFVDPAELPSVGDIMSAITAGAFDGRAYDEAYPERIRQTIS